jgi:U3 small nucleolar RNA-associated protein 25
MAIDSGSETTTQLLTLLNVSATKAGKRKWILDDDLRPAQKLNKRQAKVTIDDASPSAASVSEEDNSMNAKAVSDNKPDAEQISEEQEENDVEEEELAQGMTIHVQLVVLDDMNLRF